MFTNWADAVELFWIAWNGVTVALIVLIPVVGIFDAGTDEGVENE